MTEIKKSGVDGSTIAGAFLMEMRKRAGMSTLSLSRELCVAPETVYKIERGERRLGSVEIAMLSQILSFEIFEYEAYMVSMGVPGEGFLK